MDNTLIIRNEVQEIQALQDTLYVIGGKWRLPIMNSLCNGNTRFREIERSIPGITTRMLSKELRELEQNGIISRTVHDTSPVLVEYKTTEYCKTFSSILLEMIRWGIEHKKHITRKSE